MLDMFCPFAWSVVLHLFRCSVLCASADLYADISLLDQSVAPAFKFKSPVIGFIMCSSSGCSQEAVLMGLYNQE